MKSVFFSAVAALDASAGSATEVGSTEGTPEVGTAGTIPTEDRQGVEPDLNRNVTKDDAKAALGLYLAAVKSKKLLQKNLRTIIQGMRNGIDDEDVKILVKNLYDLSNGVQEMVAEIPTGVTIKGGANKSDLIVATIGNEGIKAVTDRVKESLKRNHMAE